ncbi:MAG: zinc ribbon domain-containing protein [Desulfobulbaceae bacterium]|nr:zinc ribbon domain-containing protein [Desulfobulbaceae bacterium]
MQCPKCDKSCVDTATECRNCGIIFSKFYKKLEEKTKRQLDNPEVKFIDTTGNNLRSLKQLLFYTEEEVNYVVFGGRLILFTIILIYGVKFCFASIESNYAGKSFLHLVNLPFHEAGHVFLRPFPRLLTSLGGTIGQLAMPLTCMVVLLLQTRDTFGASVCLWWVGQNFFDIAPYINDARSLSLPLVGGNVGFRSPYGFHDWEFILSETGLLSYDHFLARFAVGIGIFLFLVAYSWGSWILIRQYRNLK